MVYAEAPSTTTTQVPDLDFYDGCDVSKTCFGIGPGDCVRNRQCNTIGAVIHDDGKFTFEMLSSGEKKFSKTR